MAILGEAGCGAVTGWQQTGNSGTLRTLDFRILGPLEVLDEGRAVPLGGARQRALLAVLLLHANETVSIYRLIEDVWGGASVATATKTVQVHVSRLR